MSSSSKRVASTSPIPVEEGEQRDFKKNKGLMRCIKVERKKQCNNYQSNEFCLNHAPKTMGRPAKDALKSDVKKVEIKAKRGSTKSYADSEMKQTQLSFGKAPLDEIRADKVSKPLPIEPTQGASAAPSSSNHKSTAEAPAINDVTQGPVIPAIQEDPVIQDDTVNQGDASIPQTAPQSIQPAQQAPPTIKATVLSISTRANNLLNCEEYMSQLEFETDFSKILGDAFVGKGNSVTGKWPWPAQGPWINPKDACVGFPFV
jgi:hypothetical protein